MINHAHHLLRQIVTAARHHGLSGVYIGPMWSATPSVLVSHVVEALRFENHSAA